MNKLLYLTTYSVLFVCFWVSPLSSQTPTASFATWKDNKKAAYTIIHDDYSVDVTSIYKYADPLATSRGIKICFGAITSQCGATEWSNARTMISHGHECVNHSHNHLCGGTSCSGVGTYGPAQFATELGTSTQLIERNTGVRPRFFIHPYDEWTTEINNYLANLGYIGTRSGEFGVTNPDPFTDFMHVNFWAWSSSSTTTDLKESVDLAIAEGGYSMYEFHGISDNSFGPIPLVTYTNHLNYVKTQMNNGNIWSATASEAISYTMQRNAYKPTVQYDAASGLITVSFVSSKTLDPAVLKTPITLNINLNNFTGNYNATQNGVSLPSVKTGNILSVNVYPHKGRVLLSGLSNGNLGCLQASYFNNVNLSGSPISTRYETSVNNNWGTAAPNVTGLRADNFSVRWNGSFTAAQTGTHQFTVKADDGVRLWVNNTLVINQWKDQVATSYTASVSLKQGIVNTIKMEYYEKTGNAVAQLSLKAPNKTSQIMLFSPNCSTLSSAQSANIVSLDGRLDNNRAALQWAVNSLQAIDYYQIEKRNEKGEFTPLSIVNDDNQSTVRIYNFTDENLNEGDNDYRIQTIFTDNSIAPQYSSTLKINYLKPNSYNIFPNPAQNNVQIDLTQAVGKKVDIHIFSLMGKELYQEQIESATSAPHTINISPFEMGQYMLQINVAGQRSVTRKLVIGN